MKLPAYRKYKSSGSDWLGNVPKNWEVKRLKYSASINDEALPETTRHDFEFSYVDIGSVDSAEGVITEEKLIFETAPSRARRIVRNGDTIVSTVRTYLRAIAPIRNLDDDLIVSTGFAVIRPRKIRSDFLSYALRESSFVETIVARSVGVSYPAINASEVGTIPIPLPPVDEQRVIADFLDRETARLDRLVGKKRGLIEKLKERRTALISDTVTRGLNPNVKLKPSGIEWLGDIPEHWEIKRLKHLGSIVSGFAFDSSDFTSSGVRVLKIANVQTLRLDWSDDSYLPEEFYEDYPMFAVCDGDVVFALTRPIISTGLKAAIAVIDKERVLLNQRNALFKTFRGVSRNFFYHAIFSIGFRAAFEIQIDFTGQQPNISPLDIGNIKVASPPFQEQRAIADYLDRETAKIDKMIEKVEAAIEKLQEYRTALITAAVTGKIDIRKVAA